MAAAVGSLMILSKMVNKTNKLEQTKRQGNRPEDIQPRDNSGIPGRRALGVVEVSRDCDDSVSDLTAEVGLQREGELW